MVDATTLIAPARRLRAVTTCGMVALSALAAAFATAAVATPLWLGETLAGLTGFPAGPMQGWRHGALVAVAAMHLLIWIALFGFARRVFGGLAEGEPEAAARAARRLSHGLWALLVWGLVSQMIVSVVATWEFAEGERALALAIGTPQISVALSALLAGFMARAFALGAELWRDHEAVV